MEEIRDIYGVYDESLLAEKTVQSETVLSLRVTWGNE